jgi:hypothetical protein
MANKSQLPGIEVLNDYLLMTAWHADESLEEAFWFFKMNAIPAECHVFANFDRFAVAVGNPEWANRMMHALSAQDDDVAEAV